MKTPITILSLGDSYTCGESLPSIHSFPYQLVQAIRKKGYDVQAPEIIAKTGWTTAELEAGMKDYVFASKYDFVTLLIGVNNQYRGMEAIGYKQEFEGLLQKAIRFANGEASRVIVVSIPDYSVTPFSEKLDREKVSHEIDIYNSINRALSLQYKTQYVDITEGSRLAKNDPQLIAADGLHPSHLEYQNWAAKVVETVLKQLK